MFCPTEGQIAQSMPSPIYAYQIWPGYLDLWGREYKKWFWLTFGSKAGERDPIKMKLKFDSTYWMYTLRDL